MSKAFTKESDEGAFEEVILEPKDLLPAGTKNYVTPEGAEALRTELTRLEDVLRPQVVAKKGSCGAQKKKEAEGQSLSPKARLAVIDRRIVFLRERLARMDVVDLSSKDQDRVHFGATVTIADPEGNEKVYKIVGVDESQPAEGKVSFISPVAKALISAREGDVVTLELPTGNTELEILSIDYV